MKETTTHTPPLDIEIQQCDTVFQGYYRIDKYHLKHRLYDGSWSKLLTRELFERGHAAGVLPYDPHLNKVVLIEQFRIGALNQVANPWLLEIIAGIIQPDETPEEVARREAQEEAGLILSNLLPIHNFLVSPGATSEKVSLFCAKVDASQAGGIHGLAEEGENIRVLVMDTAQAYQAVTTGQIINAAAIIALQWLQINEQQVRKQWLSKSLS